MLKINYRARLSLEQLTNLYDGNSQSVFLIRKTSGIIKAKVWCLIFTVERIYIICKLKFRSLKVNIRHFKYEAKWITH